MSTLEIADIEVYLKDEGLSEEQISTFIVSHNLQTLAYDKAWEIVEEHIFRDDDDTDL